MTDSREREILSAFDEAVEISSRWPSLLRTLGFGASSERPGSSLLNDALVRFGYRRVIDESDHLKRMVHDYPDEWWFAIAKEVTGRSDAKVSEVVEELHAATKHAAQ
jgi:hypothetical protein